jgi:hypothetical protein
MLRELQKDKTPVLLPNLSATTPGLAHRFAGAVQESPLPAEDLQNPGNFSTNPTMSRCIKQ